MLIIKNTNNKTIKSVAKALRAGAVVVYPTDTAYALGCDATNAKAVARIFKIKIRAASKALPLIVADKKMVRKFFLLPTHYSLLTKHWPGPLSIILKAKKGIAKKILKSGTAAVRVPDSRLARELSRLLGRPLVATSANLSGLPACYSVGAYLKQVYTLHATRYTPDITLDAGALPRRKPSTIVCVSKSGTIEVLRKGPINIFRAKR